jgi:hypothetical protein
MPIICTDEGRTWVERPMRIGDVVKVTLGSSTELPECPWAVVTDIGYNGSFRGRITNELLLTSEHGYSRGDEVTFQVTETENTWIAEPFTQ